MGVQPDDVMHRPGGSRRQAHHVLKNRRSAFGFRFRPLRDTAIFLALLAVGILFVYVAIRPVHVPQLRLAFPSYWRAPAQYIYMYKRPRALLRPR